MRGKTVFIGLRALTVFALTLVVTSSWAAINWKEKVLHNFGSGTDGAGFNASLISDAVGNFYGTTSVGGAYGNGTVFELSPTEGGGWTETVLHSFNQNGTDGAFPQASLILDAVGNLYGTTVAGGLYYDGTAFELSPAAGGGWTETVLHNFINNGTDGVFPYSNLIFDAAGNLYGTTPFGGTNPCVDYLGNGCGTVFKLSPTQDGGWTETVLHNFSQNYLDGYWPVAGLTLDAFGNLFGTTVDGGTNLCVDYLGNGCGTVFKLSPTQGGGWTETVLHSFSQNYVDGYYPSVGLMLDASGNLFGATGAGGDGRNGTEFELSPTAGGGWTETVLYSFCSQTDCTDGADPVAEPIFDAAGNIFGTTAGGGTYLEGTVFELSPTEGGGWTETVLHNFINNGTDGAFPNSGLIFDAAGNLYGTTPYGGLNGCGQLGCGTVFELSPVPACIRCSHAGHQ